MNQILLKIRDCLERISVLDTDSESEKRRKITLVLITFFSSFTGVIVGTRYFLIDGFTNATLLPGIYVTVVTSSFILFQVTKRITVLLYPFLFMIFCIPALFHLSDGGFSGEAGIATLFWAILAPIGALMFLSIRQAVWWFQLYMALVIICLLVDKHFVQYQSFLSRHQ